MARRHATALLRAMRAHLRAPNAVLHRVLAAFVGASLADLRAQLAQCHVVLAVAGHEAGGQASDFCAVDVERNAMRQAARVTLVETGDRAAVAGIRAVVTRADASQVVVVSHGVFSLG